MAKKLRITQVRSVIGSQEKKHKRVMVALGFRKNYRTLYKNDTPQIRGMLQKVRHLVTCEEIDEKDIPAPSTGASSFTVLEAASGEENKAAGAIVEEEEQDPSGTTGASDAEDDR
jgi:large subunit ribosomal protein L30